jgi:hypothetical protein
MSKKKEKKQTQILSPEKYIRQKSKNLPIYKCLINKDWEEARIAQIAIVRKHAGGNFTICIYLVDLACLGVKDTSYLYNVLPVKLDEVQQVIDREISYTLAHNIIYAAIEYAEDFGFRPHKDFTQITSCFLEEDSDDIPLMQIPCGNLEDGKPLYINTGAENFAQSKQIIHQLKDTAGRGNFYYRQGNEDVPKEYDGFFDDDDEYFDDDDDFDRDDLMCIMKEELDLLSYDEQLSLFLDLVAKLRSKKLSDENSLQLAGLIEILAPQIAGEQKIDEQLEILKQVLNPQVVPIETIPSSFFAGVSKESENIIVDLFKDTLLTLDQDTDAKKAVETFRQEIGDLPITHYLELLCMEKNDHKQFLRKLNESVSRYPDYFMIRLLKIIHSIHAPEDGKIMYESYRKLLSQLTVPITEYEWNMYIYSYPMVYLAGVLMDREECLVRSVALKRYLKQDPFIDKLVEERMQESISFSQMMSLVALLEKKKGRKKS